jgi:outer membrane lipoprotein carrier protein
LRREEMRKYITYFIVFVLLFVVHGNKYASEDINNIIKKVQKKYEKVDILHADFKQINRFQLTNIQSEIHGSIWISENNQFRFETEDQIIVSNGEKFWRYNKLEQQVLIDYAKKTQQDVFLNNFLFNISDHYTSQLVSESKKKGTKIYEIRLNPKTPDDSFFRFIKVWIYDDTWKVEKVIYTDFNDNEVEYQMEKIELNPKVSSEIFEFKAPEGVEVVDLRF